AVALDSGSVSDRVSVRTVFSVLDPGDGWIALDLRLWPPRESQVRTSLRGDTEFDRGMLYLPAPRDPAGHETLEIDFHWRHAPSEMGQITAFPHALPSFMLHDRPGQPPSFELPEISVQLGPTAPSTHVVWPRPRLLDVDAL